MKKIALFFVLSLALFGISRTSSAYIENCYEEACELPKASASQFFMDDVNGLDEIDSLSPIPVSGKFWPVDGIITGHFGKWRGGRHGGHVHVGVDIAAPIGTNVVAPLNGTVIFVGRKGGYGLTVIVDHGDGVATLYAHNSEVIVSEGDILKKGDLISKVGSSGHSTGPHLHYEVRLDGYPVNPLAWTEKLQIERS
ncbi:MAG: M23 family metallopeptidase [Deltaproteobacteria bacterium]|nr:M23 family metallopeptidase [Deltaproteobacteria bacterium]